MAQPRAAWGIEVGANAIKAVRLERDGNAVTVSDFAVIPHKKVLTTPDLDRDEMVRLSLGQFISQKSLEGEHLVMSVPGHAAFARFAKLPPVEPKKVPDIVKFEAVQQIPFPIDQVEWDYQTFTSDDSPEVEVGIFAITRERVQERLSVYADVGISPESLTLSPVAVYNAMAYDQDLAGHDGPIIFLDIGTSATDLIVAEEGRCWIRTFPLGGTHFTDAIANAFKLSYSKAEKLKKEAATSKYAKQIMQAMRPVFSDLLQDIQRSLGYYQSLHREAELNTVVGLGSTFKIPGLRKFLGQQLQVEIVRLDEYQKIAVTGREAASFAENAVNMASAYGLALQGVGLAEIAANLVPVKALREHMWHAKTKWFAAAAVLLTLGAATMFIRPVLDKAALTTEGVPTVVSSVIDSGTELQDEFTKVKGEDKLGATAANLVGLFDDREIWPSLLNDASAALASTDPQPELLSNDIDAILAIPAKERRLVQMKELAGVYTWDAEGKRRLMKVKLNVELSRDQPEQFLKDTVVQWLRDHAERPDVPYRIIDTSDFPIQSRRVSAPIMVDESGRTNEVASTSGDDRGSGPARPGRPAGSGGLSSGSSGENKGQGKGPGGGGMRGRRERTVLTEEELGSGAGGLGVGSSGGGGVGRGNEGNNFEVPERGNNPIIPNRPKGKQGNKIDQAINIDEEAPVPSRPSVYPPGSVYYNIPVTFWIEIIADPPASPDKTAAITSQEQNS